MLCAYRMLAVGRKRNGLGISGRTKLKKKLVDFGLRVTALARPR
jgi:hypothetical protein